MFSEAKPQIASSHGFLDTNLSIQYSLTFQSDMTFITILFEKNIEKTMWKTSIHKLFIIFWGRIPIKNKTLVSTFSSWSFCVHRKTLRRCDRNGLRCCAFSAWGNWCLGWATHPPFGDGRLERGGNWSRGWLEKGVFFLGWLEDIGEFVATITERPVMSFCISAPPYICFTGVGRVHYCFSAPVLFCSSRSAFFVVAIVVFAAVSRIPKVFTCLVAIQFWYSAICSLVSSSIRVHCYLSSPTFHSHL